VNHTGPSQDRRQAVSGKIRRVRQTCERSHACYAIRPDKLQLTIPAIEEAVQ